MQPAFLQKDLRVRRGLGGGVGGGGEGVRGFGDRGGDGCEAI